MRHKASIKPKPWLRENIAPNVYVCGSFLHCKSKRQLQKVGRVTAVNVLGTGHWAVGTPASIPPNKGNQLLFDKLPLTVMYKSFLEARSPALWRKIGRLDPRIQATVTSAGASCRVLNMEASFTCPSLTGILPVTLHNRHVSSDQIHPCIELNTHKPMVLTKVCLLGIVIF